MYKPQPITSSRLAMNI